MRDAFNHKIETEYLDAVVYFFINKTAYSGMIRYNANGEYNVPFGRYKNFNTKLISDEHYKLLQRTEIYNYDYSKIFDMAEKDDFIFLVITEMIIIKMDLERRNTEDWLMILEIFLLRLCL